MKKTFIQRLCKSLPFNSIKTKIEFTLFEIYIKQKVADLNPLDEAIDKGFNLFCDPVLGNLLR